MSWRNGILVLLGAAGGLLKYLVFLQFPRRRLYGLALPGGLLGSGARIFRTRSEVVPIVCGHLDSLPPGPSAEKGGTGQQDSAGRDDPKQV